jgi:hypothetical protein
MKNKLLYLVLFHSTLNVSGQNQYLIEYDRINNTEKFFELTYVKGTFTETPIKKPALKKGDMVRFRAVNVNPLVFKVNVAKPVKKSVNSPGGRAIVGVSTVLQQFDYGSAANKIGNQLTSLEYGAPDVPQFNTTRGAALSQRELLRLQSLSKLTAFHASLKTAYTAAKAYEDVADVAYATSLTKEEILGKLKSATTDQNVDAYATELRKLKESYEDIKKDSLLEESDYVILEDAYEDLIDEVDSSLMSPSNEDELISLIETAEFTKEITVVLGYNADNWGNQFDLQAESGYVDYTIEFVDVDAELGNDEESAEGLLQNHNLHLAMQTPGGFAWATGAIYVSAAGGFSNFALQEFEYGDSLRIQSSANSNAGRMTLGTSLLYNFSTARSIIPHALFGMSIGFGQEDTNPLNFLLGGGVKFRQFPFIGLSAGMSFCENYKLKNGFDLNKSYAVADYSNDAQYFIKRVFSPGYFVGININL